MKHLCIAFITSLILFSCKKEDNDTTVQPNTVMAYTVDGVHDIEINADNSTSMPVSLPINVTYHDSDQKVVSVAINAVPSFIYCGTRTYVATGGYSENAGPWSGYPSFTIPVNFYKKSGSTYVPGTYPLTLTATCAGIVKTYTFNLVAR